MIAALTDDDPEAVAEAEAPGAEGIELRTGPVAGLDSGQVDTIDHLIPAEVIEHTTIEIVVKHIPSSLPAAAQAAAVPLLQLSA